MEAIGKVIHISPIELIQTKTGGQRKVLRVIIETKDHTSKPRMLYFSLWDGLIEQSNIKIGDIIDVALNVYSTENKNTNKWNTSMRAWKVKALYSQGSLKPI